MRDFTLDDERFAVMVMRGRDGRQLPVTVDNWEEIKDAIEVSVYESQLHYMSFLPAEDVCGDFLGAWLP